MRFALLLSVGLFGSSAAAEPPIRSKILVSLPAGETTLGDATAAFAKAGRPLVLTGEWDANRKLTLGQESPETYLAALHRFARISGGRIAWEERGNVLKLATSTAPTIASLDGEFRTVATEVTARRNLESGRGTVEVTLICHWEPSFCVVRIDGEATLMSATLDVGKTTHSAANTKTATRDSSYSMTLRFPDVPREAKTISLQGSYTVTAAQAMQTVTFDAGKSEAQTTRGPLDGEVSVKFLPLRLLPDRCEGIVELTYPTNSVEFESFESALRFTRNRFALIRPDGKTIAPINDNLREDPTKTTLVYRFPASAVPKDRSGWKAVATTPTRFHEFPVTFDLPGIPLP